MIYVLMGRSGSGKTTVERMLLKEHPELQRVISDTTRPIRDGEVDGVDYHFLTKEAFKKGIENGDYIEHTIYNDWYYGINKERIRSKDDYICVTNPDGYRQLQSMFGSDVVGFVIHSNDKDRLLNYLHREKDPDCYECCRRFIADADDFKEVESDESIHHATNQMGKIEAIIKTISTLIKK